MSGEPRADFETFYAESRDRVLRAVVAATGVRDQAEDCTAEAFVRALTHWDRVAGHPAPEAWVVRTAVNITRDRARRQTRYLRLLPRLAESAVPDRHDPEPMVDPGLLSHIRSLPERQRQVLAYRVFLGLSAAQTAAELGITTGSVGTHLSRALASLRAILSTSH